VNAFSSLEASLIRHPDDDLMDPRLLVVEFGAVGHDQCTVVDDLEAAIRIIDQGVPKVWRVDDSNIDFGLGDRKMDLSLVLERDRS
jgi:hypothetical protein